VTGTGGRRPAGGSLSSAVLELLVVGVARPPVLGAGEGERGVVGGVEGLEVREAVG
jgi:hypothetical protein